MLSVFFFNDTATTEIYTLSLHDALPISDVRHGFQRHDDKAEHADGLDQQGKDHDAAARMAVGQRSDRKSGSAGMPRPISYAVFCLKKKKKNTSFHYLPHQTAHRSPPFIA